MQTPPNVVGISASVSPMTSPFILASPELKIQPRRESVWSPLFDFWTLGGLSILLWFVCHIANIFRGDVPAFEMRFMQMMTVFSLFSILCNHPHFLVSYRLGYGQGFKFILKNWFPLIFVPLAMAGLYSLAYFEFHSPIVISPAIESINSFLAALGLIFHIGESTRLGAEVVGLSIWAMYFTVGWHYCKQVYGCMMVYAFYDGYTLTLLQKRIIKSSVVFVAVYQFIYMASILDAGSVGGTVQDFRFQGFYMSALGIPNGFMQVTTLAMIISGVLTLGVFAFNYKKLGKWPSVNFLVPWVAFYIWWVPFRNLPEFYMLMVPFFHSLQYLPFAFRVESEKIKKNKWFNLQTSLRILLLLAIGF
ncbi:MAG: hypothetical protein AB7O96_12880 [Pseudobdellovibrionaceae bacterium]